MYHIELYQGEILDVLSIILSNESFHETCGLDVYFWNSLSLVMYSCYYLWHHWRQGQFIYSLILLMPETEYSGLLGQ